MIGLIPILAAASALLLVDATFDLIQGDCGRSGALTRFYRQLDGETATAKRPGVMAGLSRELAEQGSRLRLGPWLWGARIGLFALIWWATGQVVLGLLATFAADLLPRFWLAAVRRKRKQVLSRQFGAVLQSLASSIRAGNSLATAIVACPSDLARLLQGERSRPMLKEVELLASEVNAGIPVAEALEHFRLRCGVEEVDDFVFVTSIIRRTGGNLAGQIDRLAQILGQKIAVRQEVLTLTAGKRMEANLLTAAPVVMVVFLAVTSPDYMAPLFHTLAGRVLLTLGVGLLAGATYISRRIIDIPV